MQSHGPQSEQPPPISHIEEPPIFAPAMFLRFNALKVSSRSARRSAVFRPLWPLGPSQTSSPYSSSPTQWPPHVEDITVQDETPSQPEADAKPEDVSSAFQSDFRRSTAPPVMQEMTDWATPRPGQRPHRRRESVAAIKRDYFRFARIFGLDSSTTLTDIVEGIAQTAPVGRVLSVQFEKKTSTKNGRELKAANILFDHEDAPPNLVHLAKQGSFLVRDSCPWVTVYRGRAFHGNDDGEFSSRVVRIRGRADVADFSEEGIRDLMESSPTAMQALGSLGLESEPVRVRDDQDGTRQIDWRFFDNQRQTRVIIPILRRHFYRQLSITPGPDPCWNPTLYPKERTSFKSSFISPWFTKPERTWGPPRPSRHRGAPDCDLQSSQVESPLLSELLKRRQAAREAAAREEERRLDEVSQGKSEDEALQPPDKVKQEPTKAGTRLLLPSDEEEEQKRIAIWSEQLRKFSRGKPFGYD